MASGGGVAPSLRIYDPTRAGTPNTLHPQVDQMERGYPEVERQYCSLERIVTQMLSPAPASVPTARIASISGDHC